MLSTTHISIFLNDKLVPTSRFNLLLFDEPLVNFLLVKIKYFLMHFLLQLTMFRDITFFIIFSQMLIWFLMIEVSAFATEFTIGITFIMHQLHQTISINMKKIKLMSLKILEVFLCYLNHWRKLKTNKRYALSCGTRKGLFLSNPT